MPVNIGEMALAAKFYPIVFGAEPPHLPVVVCGLKSGENDYVTAENLWAQNTYVPAYVRRYPFIFMEMPEKDQLVLSIDENTDLVKEDGIRPLFDEEGKQTDIVDRALNFCRLFHQQHQETRQFTAALVEQGLLVDNETNIRLSETRRIELKGYKIIDSGKLGELDDAVFQDWRKRDWLPPIYYQLQSGSNWPNILQQAAARVAEKAGEDTPSE